MQQGLGIAYAFDRKRVEAHLATGQLAKVLAGWSITRPGLFLYHLSRRRFPAVLRAFIDCMLDRDLPAGKALAHGQCGWGAESANPRR